MVTEIKPTSNYAKQWMVSSHTDPDKEYKVSQTDDGNFKCSCPRWIFGKAPKQDCKHILGLKTSEPIDYERTTPKAAEEFIRTKGRVKTAEPVFLLQTQRRIVIS
jgi:hypothetical protein